MKLNKDFILREIAGEYILVPIGDTPLSFNGLITVNDVGAFIWNNIEKTSSEEELLKLILDEYDVDKDSAKEDLAEFLGKLREAEII
ncbi:PqqD family protein [Clostridium sp. NSJ-49]|uniref:PqqD family protein n=1 Tax=Clostridium TaxID=1485 RepID=UPI00164A6284|nr:PqqD family protein [Clostridium sp. NSJ-49]MBC5624047.1 PqqD family protein [Clostridium sp. NSJ-49]